MKGMIENNLKYCRENEELTQKELGFIFGVHETTVSGWETGKDIIPLNKLVKFCSNYGYSLDFVLGLTRNNTSYSKINKLDKTRIGKNLKTLRKNLNLSQQDIADECSISQTTYSNYELGNYLITTLSLYTICKKHNISADLLIGRKKEQ